MGWTTPNPCTVDEIATKTRKITMKQAPFDLDKYFLRFDRKCVLHNQDEKIVPCSSMNWEKIVKTGFTQKVCQKAILAKF